MNVAAALRAATLGVGALLPAGLAEPALAQLLAVDVANEIAWTTGAATFDDETARRVALPSADSALALGPLPPAAAVAAFDALDDGRVVFALDTFADLAGLPVGRDDLVVWNGSAHAAYLDGAAIGVPPGAAIDAVARRRSAGVVTTLLSFDVAVALPGGVTADDEDVVGWNGSLWTLELDGSAIGVPPGLDLDGFDRDPVDGTLFLSFDGSGELGGVAFDDEDVVAYDGVDWSLAFDASAHVDATFAAGDLAALGTRTVNVFADDFESGDALEWSLRVP